MSFISGVSSTFCNWMTPQEPNPFLRACQTGDLTFLKNNWPANNPDFVNQPIQGKLLLHEAVGAGAKDAIAFLIEKGAKSELVDKRNLTAWDYAKCTSLKKYNDPKINWSTGSVSYSSIPGFFSSSEGLLQMSLDLPSNQKEILTLAKSLLTSEEGWRELVLKASMPIPSNVLFNFFEQNTLMHYLATSKDPVFVKILEGLLQRGVSANLPNRYGQTPVHAAVANEATECLRYLLKHGGDINKVDGYGISPLALLATRTKDPMEIGLLRASLALMVAASYISKYVLEGNPEKLALFSTISQWGILAAEAAMLVSNPNDPVKVGAFVAYGSLLLTADSNSKYLSIFHACLGIGQSLNVGYYALQGMRETWKYRKWRPLKALFNTTIHAINLSHATLSLGQRIDNVVRESLRSIILSKKEKICEKEVSAYKSSYSKLAHLKSDFYYKSCKRDASFWRPACQDFRRQVDFANEAFEDSEAYLNICEASHQKELGEIAKEIVYLDKLSFWDLFGYFGDRKIAIATRLAKKAQWSFDLQEFEKNPVAYGKRAHRVASLLTHPDKIKDNGVAQIELNALHDQFTEAFEMKVPKVVV